MKSVRVCGRVSAWLAALLITCVGHSSAQTFGGSNAITVSGTQFRSQGSTVVVTGLSGVVTSISLKLNNLNVTNLNSVAMALVAPNGTALDFLSATCGISPSDVGNSTFTLADSGGTGTDNNSGMIPGGSGACPSSFSGTYLPADYAAAGVSSFGPDTFDSPGPGSSSSFNDAGIGPPTCNNSGANSCGASNFIKTFGGLPTANLNGTWTLYIANQLPSGVQTPSGSLGSWTLTFTIAALTETTTSLSTGSPNPAFTNVNVAGQTTSGSPVSFTATITPNPGGGTVTFYDSTSSFPGTVIASAVPVNGSGQATASGIVFASEGARSITAVYSGNSSFAGSTSNTATETTVNHAYSPAPGTYCNGPIPIGNNGGTNPYPSQIILGPSGINGDTEPTLTGTIEQLTVTLNNIQTQDPQDLGFLLQAANGNAFQFLSWADGSSSSIGSGFDLTLSDTGAAHIPGDSTATCTAGAPCLPTDNNNQFVAGTPDGFAAPAPSIFATAPPNGTGSFAVSFGGLGASGAWQLYLDNRGSQVGNLGSLGEWCLNFTMQANAHPTATSASASANPALTSGPGAGTSLTANVSVTDGSGLPVNGGSVTFSDESGSIGSAAVTNGTATLTNVSLPEGTHAITASYGGTNSGTEFGISSQQFNLRFNNPPVVTGTNPYLFCNVGAITVPGNSADFGAANPYPSNMLVSNLPGTVEAVSVEFVGFRTTDENDLLSQLVGPGGNSLDFFSQTGRTGANSPDTFGPVTFTLSDTGSVLGNADVGNGTYQPASYNSASTSPLAQAFTYPACPSFAPNCTSPAVGPPLISTTPTNLAAPAGTAIFGDAGQAGVFGGTSNSTYNGNGTWSLYLDDESHGGGRTSSLSGGWCLSLTENPVIIDTSRNYNGPGAGNAFEQGQPGDIVVNITVPSNTGNGPTGDPSNGGNPLKVTDTLPAGFTAGTLPTGTPWSCSGSTTIVCTNDSTVAPGGSYATLTIPVNVSGAAVSGSNQVAVSGAGVSAINVSDSVTVDAAPQLSTSKTHTSTFTQGSTAVWTITISNTAANGNTAGTITVTDSLPTAYTLASYTSTGDVWGCTGTGASAVACTTTTSIAAGGSSTISLTVNVPNTSPTSVSNTASVYGGGDQVHTSAGTAATSTDSNVPVVQVPGKVLVSSGSGQSANLNTAFANPLVVTVEDAGGVPINGAPVTLHAPASGASGTFSNGSTTISSNTNASGQLSETFTANGASGIYTVTATAGSITTNPGFSLTNNGGAATVAGVTSTAANGSYGVGAVIPVVVTFSKAVNITGTPLLALNSGGTAAYTSGSGTASLTFTYTVAAGQNSAALDATSTAALSLNGGTIADSSSTPANLTLPAPGAAGSLSANKSIVIDTTSPTLVSYSVDFGSQSYNLTGAARTAHLPWTIAAIRVVFSKPIATANAASLSGVSATGLSGLGTNTLTWNITPITNATLSTALAGSGANAIKDAAGNPLAGGAGFSQAFSVLYSDFTGDGVVTSADMLGVNNATRQPYNILADINGDGVVNITDVTIVKGQNGATQH